MKRFFLCSVLLAASLALSSGKDGRISPRNAEAVLSESKLRADIEFLSDTLCTGRKTGTPGSVLASFWIGNMFSSIGLEKVSDGSWYSSFPVSDGITGRNVIGLLPGSSRKYIIIAAHYDGIGTLDGVLYPGADSNASGVSAMVRLSEMLSYMARLDGPFKKNVLFVALDAKLHSMEGSQHLYKLLRYGSLKDPVTGRSIKLEDVELFVNLDQLGSTLAPLHRWRKSYLIMLSESGSPLRAALEKAAEENSLAGMELAFSYYYSNDFTRLFYRRVSDQRPFLEGGIRSVMFTSGITMNNNKPGDNALSLNYTVLKDRIRLIYYWLIPSL